MQQNTPEQIKSRLPAKVLKGASWLMLFQIIDTAMGFIRLFVIARLLTPNDLGLIGMALLFMQILNTFSQTGIQHFLVHKQEGYEKYLNIGWTFLFFRGIVLYVILYISAPFISQFFNNPAVTDIVRVIGLTLLIDGLTNSGIMLFQKHMAFNKLFIYSFCGNFMDFLVTIILVVIFRDVWAIVAGIMANSAIRLVASYILSTYRPKFDLNISLFKDINRYGRWIFGSNILQFIYSQGDDILVARMLGTTPLGYYQLAYRISNLPATQITHIISSVMLPAYSQVQKDIEKLKNIYLKNLRVTSFVSFFIGTMIIIFAHDFTILFLGEKWLPIVTPMRILTIWGLLRSIGATFGPVWQALGTPKITTINQTIQVLILITIIYPLTLFWGISGTSLAVVISAVTPITIAIILISKTIKCDILYLLITLIYPLAANAIVALCYLIFKQFIFTDTNLLSFFILLFNSIAVYLFMTILLSKFFKYNIFESIMPFIAPLAKTKNRQEKLYKILALLK